MRYHRVDLTEPTADSIVAEILEKERCETVLHAAFFTDPHPDLEYSHELEVVGSLHVINAAAAAGVRKLVVTSSAQVYGPHPDNPNFLSEDHPLRPQREAHSLRDRAEVEGLLRIFAQRHRAIVVTSLRPCWIVGPSYESAVTRRFESGRVVTLLGYDPLLQFLHEIDWLDAVELALERDAPGAFNLAGDGVLPLSTLLRLAGKRSLPLPHPLLYRASYLDSIARTGDPPAALLDYLRFLWVVDTKRARDELGFDPTYTTQGSLDELRGGAQAAGLPVSDRSGGGPIPPEVLTELRASVRALRGELEQRFGIRDTRGGVRRRTPDAEAEPESEPRVLDEAPPPRPASGSSKGSAGGCARSSRTSTS